MALEITTVGAKVKYCVETNAGTRPTSGYTTIPDVSAAPEMAMDVDALDASNITDEITRYAKGRQDPGSDAEFTLNHTEAVITAWNALVTAAATGKASNKACWFEYQYPGATKSYFFKAEPIELLGNAGIEQNVVDTIPARVIPQGGNCWDTKSTGSA